MQKEEAKKRIDSLREEIKHLNEAYFKNNQNLVPEEVRDSLKKELKDL